MSKISDRSQVKIAGDQIEMEIDGASVTGKILERYSGDIKVSITSPYQGIAQESGHVPLILQQFRNLLGPAGDAKAAEILTNLYRFCSYVEENKEELLATLAEFDAAVAYAKFFDPASVRKQKRMDALVGKLSELRQSLKSGEIDNVSYQRKLASLRKEMGTLPYETKTDSMQSYNRNSKASEAEMDTRPLFRESFQAFKDTPVGKLWPSTVIQYLKAIR